MSKKIITNAISAVLAMGLAGTTTTVFAEENPLKTSHSMGPLEGMEKCYGVAKAGRNDCGGASHSCAGEGKIDKDPSEWILTPTGLCEKIASSGTQPPEKA